MKARIKITLKSGVLDPQGNAIQNALGSLGFSGINGVRQGKYIELDLAETSEDKARAEVERMCKDVLPGGFSYGDYLRCGAMAAHSRIMRDVIAKAKAGTPVLGICNGFQILCESGLLPGVLLRNASLKFICRDVHMKVENEKTFFTQCYRKGQVIRLPIAHAEGNYYADAKTLAQLAGENRIVFSYSDKDGNVSPATNPNGAQENIAGICDATGRILGMMPHPERLFELALGGTDGRRIFESAVVSAVAAAA
jgi:phosphoribosylformylglycinamidine synthase